MWFDDFLQTHNKKVAEVKVSGDSTSSVAHRAILDGCIYASCI